MSNKTDLVTVVGAVALLVTSYLVGVNAGKEKAIDYATTKSMPPYKDLCYAGIDDRYGKRHILMGEVTVDQHQIIVDIFRDFR